MGDNAKPLPPPVRHQQCASGKMTTTRPQDIISILTTAKAKERGFLCTQDNVRPFPFSAKSNVVCREEGQQEQDLNIAFTLWQILELKEI